MWNQATAAACRHTGRLGGSRHVARVTVGGVQHNCLMDGGSQVTTITKSFHDTHLSPNLNKTQQDGRVGRVKLQSKNTIVIPAGKKMAVDDRARHVPMVHGAPLLVERPTNVSLPGGLICCSYIMASPRQTYFKVPILLKNESAHDIVVPVHRTLAELSVPLSIFPWISTNDLKGEIQTSPQTSSTTQCFTTGQVNPENLIKFESLTPLCQRSGETGSPGS